MEEKKLIEAFEWLHRHPELATQELETTAYLREALSRHGVRLLDTGLETGLIAEIGTGEGPVIALRADIDALPVCEQTGLPYASLRPGVMHACGHDFHAACMLGAALLLKERETALPGTVKVIFQPAEEVNQGAALMIATGLLDDVQLFFAGHTYPWYEAGTLGVRPGPVMASADRFSVKLTGKGCHAGHPEAGVDPIVALAAIVTAAQTIVSRRVNPFDSAVVSVTRVAAGNTWNVTPETAELEGTVRSMSEDVRNDIQRRLEALAKDTARAFGCAADFEYERGPAPLLNDAGVCRRVAALAREQGFTVAENPPTMIAEDFSGYLKIAPGVMLRVGTGGGWDNHHPRFTADPAVLAPAARFFAALAERELKYLKSQAAR
ncbi:MAG: amidohydrolase [Clostridia bacterium]|nr:amidohydrolase [Clostridia bacterium]